MTKKEVKQTEKDLWNTRVAGIVGYSHRIKEQRKLIKEAKASIKMFKLLKKQVKVTYRVKVLEK